MELQDKLKLVAEFRSDGKLCPHPSGTFPKEFGYYLEGIPNPGNKDVSWWNANNLKYHTSWEWQIPVWAKLCRDVKIGSVIKSGYNSAVENNKPEHGLNIIAGIIQRIKQ